MISADSVAVALKAARAQTDAKARESLAYFSIDTLGFNNADHHYEWYGFLENKAYTDHQGNIIPVPVGHVHYNNRICLMAPRSHAKSTVHTVNYPLWRIGKNPNLRVMIVGSALSQSQSFLREIKQTLTGNVKYRRVFGQLVPENAGAKDGPKWTDSEIVVRRTKNLKDPTITAVGAGGTILSRRVDLIICDDILNPENTRTYEARQKLREWFYQVLLPCLEPNGQIIVVGTAWNTEDLLHEIMRSGTYTVAKVYKAVVNAETQKVLWPARWSYNKLMALKKEMGSVSFNKAYQNEAISAEDAIFKVEWIERAKERGKNMRLLQSFDYAHWGLGPVVKANGIDLAISQKETADPTAMMTVAKTEDGTKIPLYAVRSKMSPAEQRSNIIDIQERFHPDQHKVETNGYQEALRRDLVDSTDLVITGHHTGGEKFDPDIGLNSLAVEFENDKWIIPYDRSDPVTIQMMDIFCDGLLQFPSGHTEDLVMAAWFANMALRDLTASKDTGVAIVEKTKGGGLYGGGGRNRLGLYG